MRVKDHSVAEKFAKSRWVKEGYLDNRIPGCVVGQITFAVIGTVDIYLKGDCKEDLAGKAIRFHNPEFVEDDLAGSMLADFEIPQVGEVSLVSFDPHPLLTPHPYIEWFSGGEHYRIELGPDHARILSEAEARQMDSISERIRQALQDRVRSRRERDEADWV
jgi:hypothetical protein